MRVGSYRLDELGWLQFERLCALVLQAGGIGGELDWIGHADAGRVAVAAGPLTVVVAWAPVALDEAGRAVDLARRVARLPSELEFMFARTVLVLTNADAARVEPQLRRLLELEYEPSRLTVLGSGELCERLDRHPQVRAALPSVLGLRDLGPLIPAGVLAGSRFELERAEALARVFWPTRAYERARQVLARHRFVVLTGPPEMGKTAIAQLLGLAQLTDGWEVHDCSSPDELLRAFDAHAKQVFIADDAFGSTEYRPDAAERWAGALERLLTMLDDRHWLIWTSRPAPLKAGLRRIQRERGAERFPAPGEVLVDASDLDLAEKTLILFRHAKARGADARTRALLRRVALTIVEHPHFTPERIRRLVADRLELLAETERTDRMAGVEALVRRELEFPTDAMRTSFGALGREHRELLVALLDAPAGLTDERELIAIARRHGGEGLSRPPHELIDRLTDHFLRVTSLGIGWVHPSWRDLVIDELCTDADARGRFLGACGVDGVLLALSRDGGPVGRRSLPLLLDDGDWDRLGDRLVELLRDLDDHDLARVMAALADVLDGGLQQAQWIEADAIASAVLAASARRWGAEHSVLSPFVLDTWYRVNAWLFESLPRPPLGWTWAELHPGSPPEDGGLDRDQLSRTDEWLAFAETLRRHDPRGLHDLGFFDADQRLVGELVGALRRTRDPELRPLVESVLERIRAVSPRHRGVVAVVSDVLRRARLDQPSWWVPSDILAPPTDERVASGPVEFTRDDVARVLADL